MKPKPEDLTEVLHRLSLTTMPPASGSNSSPP